MSLSKDIPPHHSTQSQGLLKTLMSVCVQNNHRHIGDVRSFAGYLGVIRAIEDGLLELLYLPTEMSD